MLATLGKSLSPSAPQLTPAWVRRDLSFLKPGGLISHLGLCLKFDKSGKSSWLIYVNKHTPSFVPQKYSGKAPFFEIGSYKPITVQTRNERCGIASLSVGNAVLPRSL